MHIWTITDWEKNLPDNSLRRTGLRFRYDRNTHPGENRQDLLQIGILSLWVQYSTRNMGLPSAKKKSDKTQIGLFIGGEVFHFGGDYDIIKTKICTNKSVQCVEKRCLSLIEYVGVDNVSRRCI